MPHPDLERIERIIGHVSEGEVVRSAITDEGLQPKVFWDAVALDPEIQAKYAVALQCRAMLLVDDMRVIADTETNAHRARNRIEVRKWEASKLDPQKWGDVLRLDVTHTIDLDQAMTLARANALPMRCQPEAIEVEYTEQSAPYLPTPTDNKSVDAAESPKPALPGLFD